MDRGGRSVLDIRPLLWKNGWPVAGDMFTGGTFAIESERSGYCLELAVEAVPLSENRRIREMSSGPRGPGGGAGPGGPGGPSGPGMGRRYSGPVTPIPDQDVAVVSVNWPAGSVGLRLGDYMLQAHQKWTITPVPNVGGYLGSPFFKITIAGTDRALAATEDAELEVVAAFTGEPEQLWRIDQLIDGTYRIIPMAESDSKEPLALSAVSVSTPSLTKFDPRSDKSRWNLRKP